MGVNLYMEDEDGAQLAEVLDPQGFVGRIVESSNRTLSPSDIGAHLERVLDLARRAQGEVHTYLKFYGD